MDYLTKGELLWSCLGCGRSGSVRVKVRVIGSYTPSEWNYFHELSTGEHAALSAKDGGMKCQQPITWAVKSIAASA